MHCADRSADLNPFRVEELYKKPPTPGFYPGLQLASTFGVQFKERQPIATQHPIFTRQLVVKMQPYA